MPEIKLYAPLKTTHLASQLIVALVFLTFDIPSVHAEKEKEMKLSESKEYTFAYGTNTCESNEKWYKQYTTKNASNRIEKQWIYEFTHYLQGHTSPIRSFSEALALRRLASQSHERLFSEYWISRTLLAIGMVDLAEAGFASLLQERTNQNSAPFQLAALNCLNQIRSKYGVLNVKPALTDKLVNLFTYAKRIDPKRDDLKNTVWESASFLIANGSAYYNPKLFGILKNSGPYSDLSLGFYHSKKSTDQKNLKGKTAQYHLNKASRHLASFLNTKNLPESLTPFREQSKLLLGRAQYALGNYASASKVYKKVHFRSNEYVDALTESSWAYLNNEDYRDAIGVSVGIQTGLLRETFAPESISVLAMSLNEMCYFPESLRMVNKYYRDYKDSYHWLKTNTLREPDKIRKTARSFYNLAIDFAQRKPNVRVPSKVASEWIRSPLFIAAQDKINLTLREKETARLMSIEAQKEQRLFAKTLLEELKELKDDYRKERIQLKPGETLSLEIKERIQKMKYKVAHYKWFQRAAPVWNTMLSNFYRKSRFETNRTIEAIGFHIAKTNLRMLSQLKHVSENHQLLEVEIFNGASEDIIWQNAHPDYQEMVSDMQLSQKDVSSDSVWDWGDSALAGLSGKGEIWEDEIGSISANLHNNCDNKNKYINVKRQLRASR